MKHNIIQDSPQRDTLFLQIPRFFRRCTESKVDLRLAGFALSQKQQDGHPAGQQCLVRMGIMPGRNFSNHSQVVYQCRFTNTIVEPA